MTWCYKIIYGKKKNKCQSKEIYQTSPQDSKAPRSKGNNAQEQKAKEISRKINNKRDRIGLFCYLVSYTCT